MLQQKEIKMCFLPRVFLFLSACGNAVTAPLQTVFKRTGLATVVTEPFSCLKAHVVPIEQSHIQSQSQGLQQSHNTLRHVIVCPLLQGKASKQ
jgi:hypothetical protein